jgi:diguanylate cyclase (GGDEF)-like protein/PAS domain S-box-containing protein
MSHPRAASTFVLAPAEAEDRFASVAASTSDAIVVADERGRIVSWNQAAERMFGYAEAEVLDRSLTMLMPERFRAQHDAGIERVVRDGMAAARRIGSTFEVAGLRRDGSEFPMELSLGTWRSGRQRFFSGIIRDIEARKRAEAQARILDGAPDAILRIDVAGRIVSANARSDRLFGRTRDEIVGLAVARLFLPRSRPVLARGLAEPDARGPFELVGRRGDETVFAAEVSLTAQDGDDGAALTAVIRDITERKQLERKLADQADHDALTGLLNRRRLEAELDEYAAYAARFGVRGALLLLDVDRFKYVNDTHGHRAGDDLIRGIGRALASCVRETDVLARLGGDEYGIVLRHTDRAEAVRCAERLLEAVRHTGLTASVGVASFGGTDPAPRDLLAAADMAMYAAKEAGGDCAREFDGGDAESHTITSRQRCAEQLRAALREDRFVLYSQRIVEHASGEATHRELLLRMLGPDGRVILPGAFIETAEHFGLIREIDRWVIQRAIGLLEHLEGALEVNVSAASVGDPKLPALIERWIASAGGGGRRLIFEITETAAIGNMAQARAFAERVTQLGCRVALDDFGAGFSSFHYLKHLPLHYLKIDGDFIRSLKHNETDRLIVRAMVDIARGLGLQTIAEFVEDAETLALVRAHGVDFSQGYFFGRPEPVGMK